MSRLIAGVGVNNADYNISKEETINGKRVTIWRCPFYKTWCHMLHRCYSEASIKSKPRYKGCSVVPEWHYFMTFREWMINQDWEGKQLDKDILFPGNKIYGPDTCVFVDQSLNKFLIEATAKRGEWPIGVSFRKDLGLFQVYCRSNETGQPIFLGKFEDPKEGHKAWLACKLEQAKILASKQTDSRIAQALIERYENYKGSEDL